MGDAIALVPWVLYQRYADRRVLEDNFDAMLRWVDYQQREAESALPDRLQGIAVSPASKARHLTMWNTGWQFGDWLAPSVVAEGGNPRTMAMPHIRSELVTAMFHAHTTSVVSQIADVIGRYELVQPLAERAARVRSAFIDEYLSEGRLQVETQGHYVLALAFGLVPEAHRAQAVARLVELIHAADDHLDTGFLSTPHLLDVLWDNGEQDLARRLLWRATPPSWLYPVDMGATTVWRVGSRSSPTGRPPGPR